MREIIPYPTCDAHYQRGHARVFDCRRRMSAVWCRFPRRAMKYRITTKPDHLLAHLSGRETAEEMQEFLRAVVAEGKASRSPFIFLDIRASRPLFNVERPGLFDCFRELSAAPSCKIAMLGDTEEL